MDIIWNTGRSYTSEGQVIRAIYDEKEGKVHFADFSRCVDGTFDMSPDQSYAYALNFARHVMSHYDRNDYRPSLESWQLLMITGRGTGEIQKWKL